MKGPSVDLLLFYPNSPLLFPTRYRQPGHSFLPNDDEFKDVECKLKKKQNLYTDVDYIQLMKSCRVNNPFEIRRLCKDDFFSSKLLEEAITNRKVDINKGKISWLGIINRF